MNLPKIDLPTYEVELPCSGKKVNFRPFLVKEQKILLMALESKNEEDIIRAIKQIIKNCVVDANYNVDEISSIDLEYFFMHLRARSIGEKLQLTFTCKNTVNDEECNHLMKFEHDILSVSVQRNPEHDKTIFFSKNVGVVMKYPSIKMAEDLILKTKAKSKSSSDVDVALDIVIECIDYIFDGETIYYTKEMNKNEVREYIDNIPKVSLDKIEKFFDTMPTLNSFAEHKCEKCGFEHKIKMDGISNFFV